LPAAFCIRQLPEGDRIIVIEFIIYSLTIYLGESFEL
jgi:hypothetical protein